MTTNADIDEDAPFLPEDDAYHSLSDDLYETETTWWSFNVPERRIGGWLHAAHMPNQGTVTWRVFAWDPRGTDPGRIAYHRNSGPVPMIDDPDLRDITFPAGGFSVRALNPTMDYHIAYADPAAKFAIEFEHRSVHPPQRFTPGEAPAMFNPHFDQLGHVTGELVLDGERIEIDCHSVRDRTWGPRGGAHMQSRKPEHLRGSYTVREPGGPAWRQVERQRGRGRIQYIFGHAGAETGFLSFVRPQDGDAAGFSPLNVGWLLKDGRFERLDKTRSRMRNYRDPLTGWSAHMELHLADVTGRTMDAEGIAVSRMSENGTGANSLMRWEFDGKIGWGEDQDIWKDDHLAELMRALRDTGRQGHAL